MPSESCGKPCELQGRPDLETIHIAEYYTKNQSILLSFF